MGGGDPLRGDPRLRQAGAAEHARLPGSLLSAGREAPLWPRGPASRRLDVVGVGQISLDRLWRVDGGAPEAPPAGLPELPGGTVATALLAAARLGLRSAYLGAVGDDAAAACALAPLRAAGVDCGGVRAVPGGRTRRALIRVERGSGEREVCPERDPAVALAPSDLPEALIEAAAALHLDLEDPAASAAAAARANAAGVPVLLDADRLVTGAEAILERIDFAIVSRGFAEALGNGSARAGLRAVAARARRLAVVTLGAEGAMACAAGDAQIRRSPAFRIAAVDTTGAGDAFHAAFLWALLRGCGAEQALRIANAGGALNCLEAGAQAGLPDRRRLEAFLAEEPPERGVQDAD